MSGLVNPPVGYVLLGLMLPVFFLFFWPWIKRWRPFTLAPTNGASPPLESPEAPPEIARLREQIAELTAERDALREGKRWDLQDYRRQRIENWRSVIQNFDFGADKFAGTDTYSQMKPHLKPDVKRKLEHPGMIIFGNEARGGNARQYMLLDEVARIEKEWDLV